MYWVESLRPAKDSKDVHRGEGGDMYPPDVVPVRVEMACLRASVEGLVGAWSQILEAAVPVPVAQ